MPLHWPMFSAAFTTAAVLFPMCSSMVLHLALERLGVVEPDDGTLVEPALHVPAVYLEYQRARVATMQQLDCHTSGAAVEPLQN